MKVPLNIIQKQRENIKKAKAANDSGTDKYLADAMKVPTGKTLEEIYKHSLVSVTEALKSNANALHKGRHHPMPFVVCQSEECVVNRTIIDSAIGIITKKVDGEPRGVR